MVRFVTLILAIAPTPYLNYSAAIVIVLASQFLTSNGGFRPDLL